jgi:hypothetical protein
MCIVRLDRAGVMHSARRESNHFGQGGKKKLMEFGANWPRAVAATVRDTVAPVVHVFNNGFNKQVDLSN